MTEIEEKIGYEFRDLALLERALTTPACRMSNPDAADNQRLEFLGDAVFGLLSADAVYEAYPGEQEGRLTVRRTHLVSGAVLAEAGERIGLDKFLKRNVGAHPLPPHAKAIADAVRAYRDDWARRDFYFAAARDFFEKHLSMAVIKEQLADILKDMGL